MKVIIINGSPRKSGNTAQLCLAFENGVKSVIRDCKITHVCLNDLNFKGCQSCFACKLKDGRSYGVCAINDDLKPVLEDVVTADCIVVASPVYLMDVSGVTKVFLERLCFSLGSYEKGYRSLAPKKVPTVSLYTMNTTESFSPIHAMDNVDSFLSHIFSTPTKRICAYNTYQFRDYSRYVVEVFDEEEKSCYRDSHWHDDTDTAYSAGRDMAAEFLNSHGG